MYAFNSAAIFYPGHPYIESTTVLSDRCSARPTLFSQLLEKSKTKKDTRKRAKGKQRLYTYHRDIICLPKSISTQDGLIKIPRKISVRNHLAMNHLIGKIRLTSDMSERAIMREVRSVFDVPMGCSPSFPFKILQTCGGGSKYLSIPVLSSTFSWTAAVVAGTNAKTPIYILAEADLNVSRLFVLYRQCFDHTHF